MSKMDVQRFRAASYRCHIPEIARLDSVICRVHGAWSSGWTVLLERWVGVQGLICEHCGGLVREFMQ